LSDAPESDPQRLELLSVERRRGGFPKQCADKVGRARPATAVES
jgi:hypothetical protein